MEPEPPNGLLCFCLNFLVHTSSTCSKESSPILPPNFGVALICVLYLLSSKESSPILPPHFGVTLICELVVRHFLPMGISVSVVTSYLLCQKPSPWSQGRKTPFGRTKHTAYSPYKEKSAIVQKNTRKKRHVQTNKRKNRKKHVWLSGRLHIEGLLNEGPGLQRKYKDEKEAKQNKRNSR